jgi:hypothetical protein
VYGGPSIHDKDDAIRVGLYILRGPASATRLQLREDGLLKYLAKGFLPDAQSDPLFEPNGRIFDPLEWIARLTSHIPQKGAQTAHYYGAYSNLYRGKAAKRSRAVNQTPAPRLASDPQESQTQWAKSRRKSWAALIRHVFEADPLLCPRCGQQMQILSFIKEGKVIDRILDHIGYGFEVQPLPCRPPPDTSSECNLFSED